MNRPLMTRRTIFVWALACIVAPITAFAHRPRVRATLLYITMRQGTFYSTGVTLDGSPYTIAVRGRGPGPWKLAAQRFDDTTRSWQRLGEATSETTLTLDGISGLVNFELDVPSPARLGLVQVTHD